MKTFHADALTTVLADVLSAEVPLGFIITAINTDTRSLEQGQTFCALSGEQFDGHDFIDVAVEKGASGLLVERLHSASVPQLVVKNTRVALGLLAANIRQDFANRGGKVIGLTGSVGKTTSKQMLSAILSEVGVTHATKGNLNNDLGVPFTWFDLPEHAQYAVIEMGADRQGEIDYLANISLPDVAMVTNAGECHLEGFGGLDGVAKGKGEIFQHLSANGVAVINHDDPYHDYWRGLVADGVDIKTFSLSESVADVYSHDISPDGGAFELNCDADTISVTLPSVGQHNVMNALGSAACALALGVDIQHIAHGLANFQTAKGRLESIVCGNVTIIDDTYNANPMSMRASSGILSASSGYRVMVLGDMCELGDDSQQLHEQLGHDLRDQADAFYCLGEEMTHFARLNPRAQCYTDISALNQALRQQLVEVIENDTVVTILVKGSRSMQMERVVNYLVQHIEHF